MSDYKEIVAHYERCLAQHGDSHKGVDWPNAHDAHTRYAVMLGLARGLRAGYSLLDFGCGASHLFDYMGRSGFGAVDYAGLDISPRFIELSRSKYPENRYFCLDVLRDAAALPDFDYIVLNGVLTEKRTLSHADMFAYAQDLLSCLFPKARRGMAFNLMSKHVDWERDDLFHVPLDDIAGFLTRSLSRHYVIRNDYGLYEYTVYVYRQPDGG